LLSGAGGDDISSGYRRHFALTQERAWSWLPNAARQRMADIARATSPSSLLGRRFRKAFQYAGYDGDRRIASYFSWIEPERLFSLYGPTLREALAGEDPLAPLMQSLSDLPDDVPALQRMLYLDTRHFLADHNLSYTDRMGMVEGVEIRVPLLDVDLVAMAAGLPSNLKYRGREGKWVFKKAMEPYLPKEVIYRPKTGFGAPLRDWLKHPLRERVDELLSERSLAQRGLFDAARVREFVRLDREGVIDGTYTVFAMMCIELWCRIFLDQGQPSPTGV
jgi:asparagine synthase (glutamine-hydrolysing)